MGRTLIIFTDSARLGEVLERYVRRSINEPIDVVRLTYDQYQRHPQLLHESDYFVLELFRNYPGGMRAEGVTLAELLCQRGKRVLVVSYLSLGKNINSQAYWDIESDESLDDRLRKLPDQDEVSLSAGIILLKETFGRYLKIPPQHTD